MILHVEGLRDTARNQQVSVVVRSERGSEKKGSSFQLTESKPSEVAPPQAPQPPIAEESAASSVEASAEAVVLEVADEKV